MAEHEPCIGETSEWYTPPEYFKALGLVFDLDPCSPGPGHWVPAKKIYTIEDDGLRQPWFGLVFMNPPYGGQSISTTPTASRSCAPTRVPPGGMGMSYRVPSSCCFRRARRNLFDRMVLSASRPATAWCSSAWARSPVPRSLRAGLASAPSSLGRAPSAACSFPSIGTGARRQSSRK